MEYYTIWCNTKYYCLSPPVGHRADAGTIHECCNVLQANSLFGLFLETTSCLWDSCVLPAEDAESAAQGERWCMQQIVAAAEAGNSDGFRLKAPQIPSRPTCEQPPVSV